MSALEAVVQQSRKPAPTRATTGKARHLAPVPGTDDEDACAVSDVVSVLIGWLGDYRHPHQVDLALDLADRLGSTDAPAALDDAAGLLRAWSWSGALVGRSARPPRYNLTGACVMCFTHGCTSKRCAEFYRDAMWEICRLCDGSGFNTTTETICDCEAGMVDLTHSEWINRPAARPPRLNLAGYCLWCSQQWCNNPTCIDRHPRSIWQVCPLCDGLGIPSDDATTCACTHGLVEAEITT